MGRCRHGLERHESLWTKRCGRTTTLRHHAGTTVDFLALGVSTASYLWRRFRIERRQLLTKWVVLLNAGSILYAWAVKWSLDREGRGLWPVAGTVLSEATLIAVYFLALRKLKAGWISELEKRLIPRRHPDAQ